MNVIDRTRKLGITSTIKIYISYSQNEMIRWKNAGWDIGATQLIVDDESHFHVWSPLRLLLKTIKESL